MLGHESAEICTKGEIPEGRIGSLGNFGVGTLNSAKQKPEIHFSVERILSEKNGGEGIGKSGFYSVTELLAYKN